MLSLKSSKRIQTLNSDTVFDSWSAEKIQNNIKSLKTKAGVFNCELRITRTQIQLVNSRGDYFAAIFDDDYNIESIELHALSLSTRSDDVDAITEEFDNYYDALNELKAAWRAISQWLDLIAYAKANNLNSSHRTSVNSSWGKVLPYSGKFYKLGEPVGEFAYHAGSGSWNIYPKDSNDLHWLSEAEVLDFMKKYGYTFDKSVNSSRRKLNSSLDYDYAGEELEDGYFEGSVAGVCSGLSQKYANAKNWQFSNDVAAYVSTAADIISATQHNDNFEVEISAENEDEFEATVAEVVEFLKTLS